MLAAAHWAYVESVLQPYGEDQGLIPPGLKAEILRRLRRGIETTTESLRRVPTAGGPYRTAHFTG